MQLRVSTAVASGCAREVGHAGCLALTAACCGRCCVAGNCLHSRAISQRAAASMVHAVLSSQSNAARLQSSTMAESTAQPRLSQPPNHDRVSRPIVDRCEHWRIVPTAAALFGHRVHRGRLRVTAHIPTVEPPRLPGCCCYAAWLLEVKRLLT